MGLALTTGGLRELPALPDRCHAQVGLRPVEVLMRESLRSASERVSPCASDSFRAPPNSDLVVRQTSRLCSVEEYSA